MRSDVLVADLFDVEKSAFCADVRLAQIFHPIYNGGTNSTRNAVVIRLTYAAQCRYIGLVQEVLCVIFRAQIVSVKDDVVERLQTHLRHPSR